MLNKRGIKGQEPINMGRMGSHNVQRVGEVQPLRCASIVRWTRSVCEKGGPWPVAGTASHHHLALLADRLADFLLRHLLAQ